MSERSSSPLRHLDISDDAVRVDMAAEKARELINAYERIEDLQQAIRELIAMIRLVSLHADVSPALADILTTNHAIVDARELLT